MEAKTGCEFKIGVKYDTRDNEANPNERTMDRSPAPLIPGLLK